MNRSAVKKLNKPGNKCGDLLNRHKNVMNRICCRSCNYKPIHKKEIEYNQTQHPITTPGRNLIIGSSGTEKTHLMLSLQKRTKTQNTSISFLKPKVKTL